MNDACLNLSSSCPLALNARLCLRMRMSLSLPHRWSLLSPQPPAEDVTTHVVWMPAAASRSPGHPLAIWETSFVFRAPDPLRSAKDLWGLLSFGISEVSTLAVGERENYHSWVSSTATASLGSAVAITLIMPFCACSVEKKMQEFMRANEMLRQTLSGIVTHYFKLRLGVFSNEFFLLYLVPHKQ